jgi:hypothetical protein
MYRPRKRRGMGEYPGYYCYDAARPSWLPYWLDSITESTCKYNPVTIAGNIKACVAGSPNCGTPSVAQQNPDLSGPGVAPAGETSNTPTCSFGQVYDAATNTCVFSVSAIPTWAFIAAGVAAFGMVALGGGSPRRYGR